MSTSPDPAAEASEPPARAPVGRGRWLRRTVLAVVVLVVVAFVAIQFVPVHRTNPTPTAPVTWDSPQTEALARRACMDCHSDETRWPWYARVAPASWLLYYDVTRGRQAMNLSEYGATGGAPEAAFRQPTDLAYRLGQILAGERQARGRERLAGGTFPTPLPGQERAYPQFAPGGGFPTPQPGQQPSRPSNVQFPAGGRQAGLANDIRGEVGSERMPPPKYLLMHPSARLSPEERTQLIDGLIATLGLPSQ